MGHKSIRVKRVILGTAAEAQILAIVGSPATLQ